VYHDLHDIGGLDADYSITHALSIHRPPPLPPPSLPYFPALPLSHLTPFHFFLSLTQSLYVPDGGCRMAKIADANDADNMCSLRDSPCYKHTILFCIWIGGTLLCCCCCCTMCFRRICCPAPGKAPPPPARPPPYFGLPVAYFRLPQNRDL
jgi:hypothetical protein